MAKRSFGNIQRLASSRYRARYTGPDGAFHNAHTTFETREDAEGWLTDERRLISSGDWVPPSMRAEVARRALEARGATAFANYSTAWLEGKQDLKPTTRASYEASLRCHLVPAFGHLAIDEITVTAVRTWYASYGSRTPTARSHAYAVLAAIMAQAVEDELITRSPCRIRAGGRSRPKREPEVLTLSELLALAEAMPAQHRALTLVSGFCGLRFGEAVALRRRDVDLTNGVLTVTRTMIRAEGTKTAGPPKTKAARRDVAMPALVTDALRAHLANQPVSGRDALVFPGADGELLSPTSLYGRPARIEKRGRKTYLKQAYGFAKAKEAIDRPDLHWHDLRRTAATLGAQAGATVREMQHRLGHETPAMALHYQQATAERDRTIADRLQAGIDALANQAAISLLPPRDSNDAHH